MTGHRILVVEDAPDLALAVSMELEEEGFVVVLAHSGAEAREEIAKDPPELVILDMELPDTTGIALCEEIRKSHSIPLIIFSGINAQASVLEVIQRGATDYVLKGSGLEKLVARVKHHLQVAVAWADDAPGSQVVEATVEPEDPGDRRRRVLVVEADPALQAELVTILAGAGFRVLAATSDIEAVELIKTAQPHVVMVTLDTPRAGGLKFAQELKASKQRVKPGIVGVSRRMSPEAIRRAKYHGVSAFVTRPWNPSRIHTEISNAIDLALRASRSAA